MEKYYDLVMANTIVKYIREDVGMDLPGTGFDHLPKDERWMKVKETFTGSRLGVITEWGLIDFDEAEMRTLKGGEGLTYDSYLDAQKASAKCVRTDFQKIYYDCQYGEFTGCVERINKKKGHICFEQIWVRGWDHGGVDCFDGKENNVWMDLAGFEEFRVGDCLAFSADVYRYVKSGHGKMINFGLRDPENIRKIESYKLPSNEQLRTQAIDQLVCEVCLFADHCNGGMCLANKDWRKQMRTQLLRL